MMEMERKRKIKDIIPLVNGIFGHINYDFKHGITKNNLDLRFIADYGNRIPAPIIELINDGEHGRLDNDKLNLLGSVILENYKEKWDRIGAIYDLKYDPIHNYLDEWGDTTVEFSTEDESGTTTGSVIYGKVDTDVVSREDETHSETSEESSGTGSTTNNLTNTSTHVDNKTVTQTDDLSEETSYGKTETRTDNLSEETSYGKTETRTDDLTNTKNLQTTDSGSNHTANDVYGMNSDTAVPHDISSGTTSNTNTVTGTDKNTGTQATAGSGKDTVTNTGTETTGLSGKDTKDNTGTRTIETEDDSTDTVTNTGSVTTADEASSSQTGDVEYSRNIHDTRTLSGSDSTSGSSTSRNEVNSDVTRSGSHKGNIGNITTQQLIKEEVDVWRWTYMNEILNDVKELCTLPMYYCE